MDGNKGGKDKGNYPQTSDNHMILMRWEKWEVARQRLKYGIIPATPQKLDGHAGKTWVFGYVQLRGSFQDLDIESMSRS